MTDPIPLLDLAAQHQTLEGQLRAAFDRVLGHGGFILGKEVAAFEAAVAAHLGVDHAIGVSSGTDALLVALMALDIGPGDEVVTTPFSFFATAGVISRLGATPVFADIDPETFNLRPEAVAAARTAKTKAVIGVDLFGQPCDIEALRDAAGPATFVEDAAQSFGASYRSERLGGHAPLVCFSFFPAKNLGGLGDGGMVTTPDEELATKIRRLRLHGSHPKYFHAMIGGNFRLDALQAAFLNVKLPHLEGWIAARRANADYYDGRFADAGLPPERLRTPPRRHEGHSYNQYVIRTDRRDELRDALSEAGISTAIYYPRPLHMQECFADLGYSEGDLPVAEKACDEVLAIPVGPNLTEANRARVASTIITALER